MNIIINTKKCIFSQFYIKNVWYLTKLCTKSVKIWLNEYNIYYIGLKNAIYYTKKRKKRKEKKTAEKKNNPERN